MRCYAAVKPSLSPGKRGFTSASLRMRITHAYPQSICLKYGVISNITEAIINCVIKDCIAFIRDTHELALQKQQQSSKFPTITPVPAPADGIIPKATSIHPSHASPRNNNKVRKESRQSCHAMLCSTSRGQSLVEFVVSEQLSCEWRG